MIHPVLFSASHAGMDYTLVAEPAALIRNNDGTRRLLLDSLRRLRTQSPEVTAPAAAHACTIELPGQSDLLLVIRSSIADGARWLGPGLEVRDFVGRQIRIDEGFVCSRSLPVSEAHFKAAAGSYEQAFRRFWRATGSWTPIAVDALLVVADAEPVAVTTVADAAPPAASPDSAGDGRGWSVAVEGFAAARAANIAYLPDSDQVLVSLPKGVFAVDRTGVATPVWRAIADSRQSRSVALRAFEARSAVAFTTPGGVEIWSNETWLGRRNALLSAPLGGPSLVRTAGPRQLVTARGGAVTVWRSTFFQGWQPSAEWHHEGGPVTALDVQASRRPERDVTGLQLAIGDRRGRISAYSALHGGASRVVFQAAAGPIDSVCLSPNGDRVLAASGSSVSLHSARQEHHLSTDHELVELGFVSPGAGADVTAWAVLREGILREWHAATGELLASRRITTEGVVAATRAVDGRWLVVLTATGAIRCWHQRPQQTVPRGSSRSRIVEYFHVFSQLPKE